MVGAAACAADGGGAAEEPAGDEPAGSTSESPSPGPEPPGDADAESSPPPEIADVEPFATSEIALAGDGRRHAMPVYVADDAELRAQGLMGWESLPERAGMLFVFDDDHRGGFWMKDTLIPLSIAFADADGEILAILDMDPCEEEPCPTYDPEVTYRYALEVNQGAFADLGVEPGWRMVLDEG